MKFPDLLDTQLSTFLLNIIGILIQIAKCFLFGNMFLSGRPHLYQILKDIFPQKSSRPAK